jgi:hypothetical protein
MSAVGAKRTSRRSIAMSAIRVANLEAQFAADDRE